MPTTKHKKKKRKSGRKKGFFRRLPSHALWIIVVVIAVAYVAVSYKNVELFSYKWKAQFSDDVTYPAGTVRGIDVSHHQGKINWEKLRNVSIQGAQISFVFVKATEGSNLFDDYFNRNFHAAKKNGMLRGAYHYFTTKTSAQRQAEFFCKMVPLDEGDLPPVLDVEEKGNYSKAKLQKEVKTWLDIVEKHYGVKPILYTGYKFKLENLNSPQFDGYPLWIARYYVEHLEYRGKWTFWQHTDAGKLQGVKENVDINLFNGEIKDLLDLTIKND